MVWPAIIAAGAQLAGGLLSAKGQRDANSANQQIAANNIEFQREMANTAYQRSMADMQKAGLNPILAYKTGGAATPSGTTIAQQNELGALGDAVGGAASSALNARQQQQELYNLQQTEEAIRAAANRDRSQTQLNNAQNHVAFQSEKLTEANVAKTKAETDILDLHKINAATSAKASAIDSQMLEGLPFVRGLGAIFRELGITGDGTARTIGNSVKRGPIIKKGATIINKAN